MFFPYLGTLKFFEVQNFLQTTKLGSNTCVSKISWLYSMFKIGFRAKNGQKWLILAILGTFFGDLRTST